MAVRHRQYLADNLWLISHEERNGKPYVSPLSLGLGLAGCLLAELVMYGRVTVDADGRLKLANDDDTRLIARRDPAPIHDDGLADAMLKRVIREARKPREEQALLISPWLNSLSGQAEPWVAKRLRDQGVIVQFEHRKGLFKRAIGHYVHDLGDGMAPLENLKGRLRRGETVAHHHVALAGFAIAIGLDKQLLRDTTPAAQTYLEDLLKGLPKPLRSLIAETNAAVGNAVMTHRG